MIDAARRKPEIAWLLLASGAFVVASHSFWASDAIILDDYVACATTQELGIVGMAKWYFFDFVGIYRPLTIPMLAGTGALCQVPVVLKAIGLALHLAAAWLAFHLARTGFGWHGVSSAVASIAILFSPVALAGAGWVAASRGYALGLVVLLWFILRLTAGKRDWVTILVGTLTVLVQEQTIFVVLLLPFVMIPGTFRRRIINSAVSAVPILAYLAVLTVTSRLVADAGRFGAENGPSLSNAVEFFGSWIVQIVLYLPLGWNWTALAHGPFTPVAWVSVALIVVGVIVIARHDRSDAASTQQYDDESTMARRQTTAAVALFALLSVVLFILPMMLSSVQLPSPRIMYLPLAAVAFVVAAAVELLILRTGRRSVFAGAVVVIVWSLLVAPGIVRDASALADSGQQEQAIANQIAVAAIARGSTVVIVENAPWALPTDGTSIGMHLAHSIGVWFAAESAISFLTDFNPDHVAVVRDGGHYASVCVTGGTVVDTTTARQWPLDTTIIYDFNSRAVVPESQTADHLPECPVP